MGDSPILQEQKQKDPGFAGPWKTKDMFGKAGFTFQQSRVCLDLESSSSLGMVFRVTLCKMQRAEREYMVGFWLGRQPLPWNVPVSSSSPVVSIIT